MTIETEDIKNRNGSNLNLKAIYDVPMKLKVVLGQAEFKVSDLLKLNKGDKIELDKKVKNEYLKKYWAKISIKEMVNFIFQMIMGE